MLNVLSGKVGNWESQTDWPTTYCHQNEWREVAASLLKLRLAHGEVGFQSVRNRQSAKCGM